MALPDLTRRTKIVATIGPATESPQQLRRLIEAGATTFRLNFSHGDHSEHAARIATIRQVAHQLGVHVGILQDLQGPKIRLGRFKDGPITVAKGDAFTLTSRDVPCTQEIATVTYDKLAEEVVPGSRILLDDGRVEMVADRVDKLNQTLYCTVTVGGVLSNNKGVNFPDVQLSIRALTDKDRTDLAFGLKQGVDWVALSFVRNPSDMQEIKELIAGHGFNTPVVAKIAKFEAIDQIDAILPLCDGVMVARGDLGVELPFEDVPLQQKRIIALAARYGRPVITATQMLESMIQHTRPTRAEASDVANAILDGTDAVMLSAETAAGAHPVEAVRAMRRIATAAEAAEVTRGQGLDRVQPGSASVEETIASASVTALRLLGARTIVVFTKSGFSARIVAGRRPQGRIVALTDQPRTYRQLALVWGVIPILVQTMDSYEGMIPVTRMLLRKHGLAEAGEAFVVTAGVPFNVPGTTNLLKVETV